MGMYDTITAAGHPIVPNGSYQTKSLECGLDHYSLRPDGSLWITDRFSAERQSAPERLTLTESAIVPDDFEGGIEDENPYPEPDVVL